MNIQRRWTRWEAEDNHAAAPGDPRLDDVIARTGELAHELEVIRGMAQPLVPDAESPPSHDARSAELLEAPSATSASGRSEALTLR